MENTALRVPQAFRGWRGNQRDAIFVGGSILKQLHKKVCSWYKRGGVVSNIGAVQFSYSVVKVIESKNDAFPVGTVYVNVLPWRRYLLDKPPGLRVKVLQKPNEPETFFTRLGYAAALGVLGMPSQTAYYGCLDVGKFNSSDVLVVSGAAGAVGIVVGQIAKHVLKCKKVIGTAGGKAKCDYVVKELGFDAAVDYKEYNTKEKMAERLKELTGEPITAYFDNTGGIVTDAVFDIIGRHGKVIVCGQIASYNNSEETPEETNIYPNYLAKTIYRALSILGFVVSDFVSRNDKEFYPDLIKWIEGGQVKGRDTLVEGFEKLPHAYEMLYTGANFGKIVVKVL